MSRRAILAVAVVVAWAAAPISAYAAAPSNDEWANATEITSVPFTATVDTTEATENGDPYSYCGGGAQTVWFRIDLPTATRVEISTAGSDYDTVIDAYWIDWRGEFNGSGCDDNGGSGGASNLVLDIPAGFPIALMVSSHPGQSGGNLSLSVSAVPPPANDDFNAATDVGSVPFADAIDAGTATTAADDPASSCGGQGPSVWYDFTPATTGRYLISTEGSDYDTLLTAYTGSRGSLSEVGCNDNYLPIGSYQARLRIDATAGATYHIGVTTAFGFYPPATHLNFAVSVAPPPPPNDDFNTATPMSSLPFVDDLDVSEATEASDDPAPSCAGPLPSTVWYSITPTTTDPIALSVRGGDFQPAVALYSGTRGTLTELDCSGGGTTPGFVLTPVAGRTYHVLVGGASGDAGILHVDAVKAYVLSLTIDRGTFNAKSGVATVSGTLTCNRHSYVSTTFGELSQTIARRTTKGVIWVTAECDGTMPWSSTVVGDSGPFVGGKAKATLSLYGYDSNTGDSSQPSVSKSIVLMAEHK